MLFTFVFDDTLPIHYYPLNLFFIEIETFLIVRSFPGLHPTIE